MSSASPIDLTISLNIVGTDAIEVDKQTRLLRSELVRLGIGSAELVTGPDGPAGTKGLDPLVLGAIAVAVVPTLITKVFELIHDWTMRREGRTIRIKIQNKDGSSIEVEAPAGMSRTEFLGWAKSVVDGLSKNRRP